VKRRSTQGKSRREENGSFIRAASSRVPPPGVLLLGVGCVFLAVEGVTGLPMAAELARPGLGFLDASRYNELLTDHDAAATALSLWPLALGLALVRVRPRPWTRLVVAAAAACLLAGGALELAATHDIQTFAYGWTSYAPNTPVSSIEHDFHEYAFGLGLAWVGVTLATAPLASVALRGRVGATAAVAAALALPFPIATAFAAATSRSWATPQHVAFLGLALTLLGSTAESLAARPPPRLYLVSVAAFAPVAAGVSIEHLARGSFGESRWEEAALGAPIAGAFAAILVGFVVSPRRRSAFGLFAAAALLQLLAAGLLGTILTASDPLSHRTDTQLVTAHLHFALLGFGLCALLALAHATWPRLSGRAGLVGLGLLVAGTAVLSIAEAVAGNRGMPRRVVDYAPMFSGENLAAAIGGGLTAAAILLFAASCAQAGLRASRRR
jgi:heme/copper-type cytochrome/quinol oxidase subunit 1